MKLPNSLQCHRYEFLNHESKFPNKITQPFERHGSINLILQSQTSSWKTFWSLTFPNYKIKYLNQIKSIIISSAFFLPRGVLLSICLSIYLFIYLSIYLSIDLSIYLSIYLSVYLSICLSIYPSIYLSLYVFIYFSIYWFMYPSMHLSVCLSICLSVCANLLSAQLTSLSLL